MLRWLALARFFGVTRDWLLTGTWDDNPQQLLKAIKGEAKVGENTIGPLVAPPKRRTPVWTRLLERKAIPIVLGEDAFGFDAGTVMWTEEIAIPQMGDRIIAELNNGQYEAFVVFLYVSGTLGPPAMLTVFPPALNWQSEDNLRQVKTVQMKDVKQLYLVVGSRDWSIRKRTVAELMYVGCQAGAIMGEEDADIELNP